MRLAATESERRLQEEVRAFLAGADLEASRLPHALDERIEVLRGWQARCYEAGYVGRAWPQEFGGGGAPAAEQIIIDQELAAAGAPEFANVVGLDVLGPSLVRRAGPDPRRRPEASRDLDADRRHAIARGRAASDDADHRPRGVLRAVP